MNCKMIDNSMPARDAKASVIDTFAHGKDVTFLSIFRNFSAWHGSDKSQLNIIQFLFKFFPFIIQTLARALNNLNPNKACKFFIYFYHTIICLLYDRIVYIYFTSNFNMARFHRYYKKHFITRTQNTGYRHKTKACYFIS